MKKITVIIIVSFVLNFMFLNAWADDTTTQELLRELQALKARVADLETKLAEQTKKEYTRPVESVQPKQKTNASDFLACVPGQGIEIEPLDLVIKPTATLVLQGTPDANNAGTSGKSQFDGSWKIDIDFEKNFWDFGYAFLEFEIGDGSTIESDLSLFSNVDQNVSQTDSRVEITKFWYDQYLFDKQMSIGIGKFDPTDWMDQNNFAGCDNTQFLTRAFKRSPVIEWPEGNTLGIHSQIAFDAVKFLEFDLGYYDSNTDYRRVLEHNVYTMQMNVKSATLLNLDPQEWEGNYRLYSWFNTRNHQKLVSTGNAPSDKTKERNYGFGFNYDQKVTDVLGVFGRCGWQRPDIIPADGGPTLEWFWSGGAQTTGKYWNREGDILGFAIGQVIPSKKYGDAGNPDGGEGHIEMYYNCKINEYFHLSPDFQLIWNPNGVTKSSEGDDGPIFVYGVRAYVGF